MMHIIHDWPSLVFYVACLVLWAWLCVDVGRRLWREEKQQRAAFEAWRRSLQTLEPGPDERAALDKLHAGPWR